MPFSLAKRHYLLIALAIVVLDQWTKWLVETGFPLHSSRAIVPGFLNLTHVRNRGVAFGMFADGGLSTPLVLTALGLVALGVVGFYFRRAGNDERMLLTALALVMGGAVGNLVDRIATGEVTDFVDAYVGRHHWPAFNVADSAITVGISLMILDSLVASRRSAAVPAGERPARAPG